MLPNLSDPITRLEKFMISKGMIDENFQKEYREEKKLEIRQALKKADAEPKPSLDNLYNEVYDELTPHLHKQQEKLKDHIRKYREHYDLSKFKDGDKYL